MIDFDFKNAPDDIRRLLDEQVIRINRPEFIKDDPVQFPHRFSDIRDIEITAFLSASIAWGNRKMICRDADRMLGIMQNSPYAYVMDGAYEELDDRLNIHRTFFASDLKYYLRGLRKIYLSHTSLDSFAHNAGAGTSEMPSWTFAGALGKALADANDGMSNSQCVATNLETTALKRINMALRWLVRDDGLVDLGVWTSIPKSKLYVPLDVHVGNTARDLGLIARKSNDRKAVMELMEPLRMWRPDDPAIYDFALFGIGAVLKDKSPSQLIR